MNVKIVTPPDHVFGYDSSLLLISPSTTTKQQLQVLLQTINRDLTIYVYDEDEDPQWLLSTVEMVDKIFVEVDEVSPNMKEMVSYLLGFSKTYWLTKGDNIYYNKLNTNRVWSIDPVVEDFIGVSIEKE